MSLIPPAPRFSRPLPLLAAHLLAASILLDSSAEASAESASGGGAAASSAGLAQLIVDWRECFTRNVVEAKAASIIAACDRAGAFPELSAKERDKISRQRLRVQEALQQGTKSEATAEQR